MNDKLPIRLTILEREYPLTIPPSEEEKLREASKRINEMVSKFRQIHKNADAQDLLVMANLQFASKLLDLEQTLQENNEEEELKKVYENLDEFIKINQ